jgi:hypothetical protein
MQRRGKHYGYKPPGIDSPRARANATLFLCGAATVDEVTAEALAYRCRLRLKTAEAMLSQERQRRG